MNRTIGGIEYLTETAAFCSCRRISGSADHFHPQDAAKVLERWTYIEQSVGADEWMRLVAKRARLLPTGAPLN